MKSRGINRNTERIKKEFLEHYAVLGAIYAAAKKVEVDRDTILRWRHKDKKFDQAVMRALDQNTDLLKETAVSRAVNGTSKGADTLLMFLLKGREPEVWRERFDVQGSGGFTLRDFMLFGQKQTALGGGSTGKVLKEPGVVLHPSASHKPVGKANRDRQKRNRK